MIDFTAVNVPANINSFVVILKVVEVKNKRKTN